MTAKARNEVPVPTKEKTRNAAGSALRGGSAGEGEDDPAVEDEVEHDVEEAAAVGERGAPRHGPVEPVAEAVQEEQPEAQERCPQRYRHHREEARPNPASVTASAGPAAPHEVRRRTLQRRIDDAGGGGSRAPASSRRPRRPQPGR
jgi:hypothetical protein